MARKGSPASNGINPATGLPWRIRAPREMRVVSSSSQQVRGRRAEKRMIPQIRLTGVWLEDIGFVRGANFIVLVEGRGQILLAIVQS